MSFEEEEEEEVLVVAVAGVRRLGRWQRVQEAAEEGFLTPQSMQIQVSEEALLKVTTGFTGLAASAGLECMQRLQRDSAALLKPLQCLQVQSPSGGGSTVAVGVFPVGFAFAQLWQNSAEGGFFV